MRPMKSIDIFWTKHCFLYIVCSLPGREGDTNKKEQNKSKQNYLSESKNNSLFNHLKKKLLGPTAITITQAAYFLPVNEH